MLQKIINILGYDNDCCCKSIKKENSDLYNNYKTLHIWQSRTRKALLEYVKYHFDLSNPDKHQLDLLMFYLIGIYLENTYCNSMPTEITFEQHYTLIINNLLKSDLPIKYKKTICSTADMSFFLSFFKEDSFLSLSLKGIYQISKQQRKAVTKLISDEITDSKDTFKKLISIFFKKN